MVMVVMMNEIPFLRFQLSSLYPPSVVAYSRLSVAFVTCLN